MTAQPNLVQPPRIAMWLISLFALGEKGESIIGDLLEEFSLLASKSGVRAARAWYWRQTIKTVPRLAVFAFRTAPLITVIALVVGLQCGLLSVGQSNTRHLPVFKVTESSSNIISRNICSLTSTTSSRSFWPGWSSLS